MGKRFKLEEMIEVTYLETIDDVSAIQSILGISTDKVKSVAKYKRAVFDRRASKAPVYLYANTKTGELIATETVIKGTRHVANNLGWEE